MQWVQGFSAQTDEAYKDSGQLIMETVTNIRTVKSFGHEETLMRFLSHKLKKAEQMILPKANKGGLAFGFSNFVMFIMYAITFYVGALFQRKYGTTPKDMFISVFAIMMSAMGAGKCRRAPPAAPRFGLPLPASARQSCGRRRAGARCLSAPATPLPLRSPRKGQSNQFMGDVGAAQNSALNLFEVLDCKDEYQLQSEQKKQLVKESQLHGNIEFRNVSFKYPSREEVVLKNLSFSIQAGQKAAFCGPSGCGKSTIMQLLQRFYDIDSGEIIIDGRNIYDYDIQFLRKQYGVVSQEPVLFNGTIKENIQYNIEGITFEEIKQAAERANALNFIQNNDFQIVESSEDDKKPEDNQFVQKNVGSGFDRQVGPKGSQISGGQKQRVAIARAILKNPQILILDEATSALDTENEKIVQASLDKIMENKTSLCIAHRISTIKDSDRIFVMEEGQIKEQGTYEQLVQLKGFFYRLERGEMN